MRVPKTRLSVRLGAMLLIAALAACGGGGVATTPVPSPSTTPSSTQTVTTSTTGSTSIPATVAAGITTTVVLPATNNGAAITEAASASAPGGVPALSKARAAQSSRTVLADVPSPILYLQFTTATTTTLAGTPALTFTLPSITAGVSYYLASYTTASSWTFPVAGPGTVSGTSVSFAATTNSVTITAAAPLTVALYSVTNTPSPTPSPTPTIAPVSVTPAILTLDGTAAQPSTNTLTVTQAGVTAFTAAINCYVPTPAPTTTPVPPPATPTPYPYPTLTPTPGPSPTATFIATLASTSATDSGTGAVFTVNGGNTVGQCIVTVTGGSAQTATATVNVDEVSVGIFSTRRFAK